MHYAMQAFRHLPHAPHWSQAHACMLWSQVSECQALWHTLSRVFYTHYRRQVGLDESHHCTNTVRREDLSWVPLSLTHTPQEVRREQSGAGERSGARPRQGPRKEQRCCTDPDSVLDTKAGLAATAAVIAPVARLRRRACRSARCCVAGGGAAGGAARCGACRSVT